MRMARKHIELVTAVHKQSSSFPHQSQRTSSVLCQSLDSLSRDHIPSIDDIMLTQRLSYRQKSNDADTTSSIIILPLRAEHPPTPSRAKPNKPLSKFMIALVTSSIVIILLESFHVFSSQQHHPNNFIIKFLGSLFTISGAEIDKDKNNKAATTRLSPMRWRTFSHRDLYTFFECKKHYDDANAVFTSDQWAGLQQYHREFAISNKKYGRTYPLVITRKDSLQEGGGEIKSILDVATFTQGHDFETTQYVPSNTIISASSSNTIVFSNGRLYRKFIWGVHHEYNEIMACHLLATSQVVPSLDDGTAKSTSQGPVILVDLDDEFRVIPRVSPTTNSEEANVDCQNDACKWVYITTRDVHSGDILLLPKRDDALHEDEITKRWKLVGL